MAQSGRGAGVIGQHCFQVWGQFHAAVGNLIRQRQQVLFEVVPDCRIGAVNSRLALIGDAAEFRQPSLIGVVERNPADDVVRDRLVGTVGDDILTHEQDGRRQDEEYGGDRQGNGQAVGFQLLPIQMGRIGPVLANLGATGAALARLVA